MKIGVLLKQVPATDTRIRINATASGIATDDVTWVINPYDEHALEEALKLRDAKIATEVVIVSIGGAKADERIREGLARGADRAVWINDPAMDGADSLGKARVLAAVIKNEAFSLVLAGKQAVDDDCSQVPSMVAEILGWPQAMFISKLEIAGDTFKATRDAGRGVQQVVQGKLPALVSADKPLNTPRYASLPGIMKARKKVIDQRTAAALGVSLGASLVKDSTWRLPPDRPKGRLLQGEPQDVVNQLVTLLREEAKVL